MKRDEWLDTRHKSRSICDSSAEFNCTSRVGAYCKTLADEFQMGLDAHPWLQC